MKKNATDHSRRRVFKALLGAGGAVATANALPDRWTRPVVESVLLPAHAQATTPLVNGTFTGTATANEVFGGGPVLDFLVPAAVANGITSFVVEVCLNITNSVADAQLSLFNAGPPLFDALLSGSGALGTTYTLSQLGGTDPVTGATLSVDVSGTAGSRHATGSFAFDVTGHGSYSGSYDITESAGGACDLFSNCLLHGSLVVCPGDSLRAIETLKPGDFVAAVDPKTFAPSFAVVTKIVTHHRRGHYYRVNGDLLITNDHPVLVESNAEPAWRRIDQLVVGDRVHSTRGNVEISCIERIEEPALTVYMETSADSFVVHAGSARYVAKCRYGVAPGPRTHLRETACGSCLIG
jgi:hypothetical protein